MPAIAPTVKRVTPVLVVDAVEACAAFWEKVGFTRTAEVPPGESLGVVILNRGDVELMCQSVASVRADNAGMDDIAPPVVFAQPIAQ